MNETLSLLILVWFTVISLLLILLYNSIILILKSKRILEKLDMVKCSHIHEPVPISKSEPSVESIVAMETLINSKLGNMLPNTEERHEEIYDLAYTILSKK